MLISEATTRKIEAHHLAREACLYVRQSSLRPVMEKHREREVPEQDVGDGLVGPWELPPVLHLGLSALLRCHLLAFQLRRLAPWLDSHHLSRSAGPGPCAMIPSGIVSRPLGGCMNRLAAADSSSVMGNWHAGV